MERRERKHKVINFHFYYNLKILYKILNTLQYWKPQKLCLLNLKSYSIILKNISFYFETLLVPNQIFQRLKFKIIELYSHCNI